MANKKDSDLRLKASPSDIRPVGLAAGPLRGAAKRFITSLRASNRYSPHYLSALEFSLAILADYAEQSEWPGVGELGPEHLEQYLAYLQTRPRWFGERDNSARAPSQSHIETQYRRMNRFFNWLVEREYLPKNPMAPIPHPHVDQRTIPTVSMDDMRGLLELVNPKRARTDAERFRMVRNRAALYILWDTPSRRDEIASLSLDSVNWEQGAIHVLGKGRKERWMTIDYGVLEMLWDYRDARAAVGPQTEALWVSEWGRSMTPNWLYLMLRRLGERAGINGLHTHRFRHTYAMNALQAGMQERYLAFEGGWRKIPETYFRTLGPEHIAERHRELSPAAKLRQATRSSPSVKHRRGGNPRGRL